MSVREVSGSIYCVMRFQSSRSLSLPAVQHSVTRGFPDDTPPAANIRSGTTCQHLPYLPSGSSARSSSLIIEPSSFQLQNPCTPVPSKSSIMQSRLLKYSGVCAIPLAPMAVMCPPAVTPDGMTNENHSPSSSSLAIPSVTSTSPGRVTLLIS